MKRTSTTLNKQLRLLQRSVQIVLSAKLTVEILKKSRKISEDMENIGLEIYQRKTEKRNAEGKFVPGPRFKYVHRATFLCSHL